MEPAGDACAICGGNAGWWAVEQPANAGLAADAQAYCGVCRPWRDVIEVQVDSLLPWQRNLINDPVLSERLLSENFNCYGGAPRVLHRWVEVLFRISADDRARDAIQRVLAILPKDVDARWAEALRGHCSRLLGSRVKDLVPSPPEMKIRKPERIRSIAEYLGHEIRVHISALEIDGELIDGGPIGLLARGLLEFDLHRPSTNTAVMALRGLHRHLGRDPVAIERLLQVPESEVSVIRAGEDASIPWCSWDARGYMIENPSWMRRLTGMRRLRLPDSLFLCDWFSHIWHGWYGEQAANQLKLVCMHWMRLTEHVRDGGVPEPIRRSFRFLASLVDENDRISVCSSGITVEGTSGVLWRISAVPVNQHPFYMRVLDDRLHMQFWRVSARAANGENGSRMRGVCLHPGNRRAPLGDQIATLCLGLMDDEMMASRIGQVSAAIHQHTIAEDDAGPQHQRRRHLFAWAEEDD